MKPQSIFIVSYFSRGFTTFGFVVTRSHLDRDARLWFVVSIGVSSTAISVFVTKSAKGEWCGLQEKQVEDEVSPICLENEQLSPVEVNVVEKPGEIVTRDNQTVGKEKGQGQPLTKKKIKSEIDRYLSPRGRGRGRGGSGYFGLSR